MSKPILYGFSQKDLENIIEKVIRQALKSDLKNVIPKDFKEDKLTQNEAADFLGISVQSLMNWKKKGVIPYYQVENSIFYLRSELLDCARKNISLGKVSRK